MGFGLFGKVPQKRDFLSVNLPNQVLHPFETWLQSAVMASRADIGRTWEQYYLVAPIWRFWIGPSVMAPGVAGALMPSVDQVGRYFPVAILYWAEPGEAIPPPLLEPMEGWYGAIDQRLLGALSQESDGYLAGVLQGLAPPHADVPATEPEPVEVAPDDGLQAAGGEQPDLTVIAAPVRSPPVEAAEPEPVDIADYKSVRIFSLGQFRTVAGSIDVLRDLDYRHATAGRSYWWCAASPGGPAQMIAGPGLPDPYVFSRMLLWPGKG